LAAKISDSICTDKDSNCLSIGLFYKYNLSDPTFAIR